MTNFVSLTLSLALNQPAQEWLREAKKENDLRDVFSPILEKKQHLITFST